MGRVFIALCSRYPIFVIAYSDADWGSEIDRKSTYGALHFVGYDLFRCTSKTQGCVALSTAEAE
jgi:hypothetical protein